MNILWQWNKQQPWLVTLHCRVGARLPMASLKRGRNQALRAKRGYWVQNSPARRARLFDPSCESDFSQETISGWKQMLLLLRGALVSPRRMLCFHTVPLLYCTAGNVWSVIFSTFDNIPMHSLLADQQTTPAQPRLSCRLTAPNPPSTPTPSNSNPAARGTPPKNLEEEIRWWLFLLNSQALHAKEWTKITQFFSYLAKSPHPNTC